MIKKVLLLFVGISAGINSFTMFSKTRALYEGVKGPAFDVIAEKSGPVLAGVARHKGKVATGAYIIYSAGWYIGVAGLTYQAKQLNEHNQNLQGKNKDLEEKLERNKERIADLQKQVHDFEQQRARDVEDFTAKLKAFEARCMPEKKE